MLKNLVRGSKNLKVLLAQKRSAREMYEIVDNMSEQDAKNSLSAALLILQDVKEKK